MAAQKVTTHPPLTDSRIERLPVGDHHDTACRGLVLRVTPEGSRAFRWRLRSQGKVITLGWWPGLDVDDARKQLKSLRQAYREGRLDEALAALRPSPPPPKPQGEAPTVRDEVERFLTYLATERREPEQVRRAFDHDVLATLGGRPLVSVTSDDVRALIEAKAKATPVMAFHLLSMLKQFFTYAVDHKDIPTSPADFRNPRVLGARAAEMSQRFLSTDEIRAFWAALDSDRSMTPTVKLGLRLLLLTGMRTGELLQATWDEVDFDEGSPEEERLPTWTIPVAHQKLNLRQESKARPWVVPLSPTAVALFKELHGLAKSLKSKNVMASFHGKGEPVSEKAMNHALRRLLTGPKAVLRFEGERPTPHDLRRTVRTHLGMLGIPWHIAESVLHHSLGDKVARTYDVGDGYLAERRVALAKWDAHLQRLLAPEQSNVAFLPAAK